MTTIHTRFPNHLFLIIPGLICLLTSCQKNKSEAGNPTGLISSNAKVLEDFNQVNLVANTAGFGSGTRIDPTLVNAWGLAFGGNGSVWVTSQGGHISEVYNSEGAQSIPPVNIPSPANVNEGGNPTGIISNPNLAEFIIPSGNSSAPSAARFIFVSLDGIVAAWNGSWGNHSFRQFDSSASSAYTGLTLANNAGRNLLYAANFRARRIDVWNGNWEPVSMEFKDPELPAGYSPFNIQNINNQLFVMYAKVASSGKNEAGQGKGFVDIYNPDGKLVKRFASEGLLNSPWGVTLAPASLFKDENENEKDYLLVGNFGDGRINVFRLSDGKQKGQVGTNKYPLVIDGLWAISFPPPTSPIDPKRLYFAAGPENESKGLFGYISIEGTTE